MENELKVNRRRLLLEALSVYIGIHVVFKILILFRNAPWVEKYLNVIVSVLLLYTPLLFIFIRKENIKRFGLTLDRLGQSVRAFFILVAIFFLPYGIGYFFYYKFFIGSVESFHLALPRELGTLLLTQLLFVGLPEEFFFRGYLQERLNAFFSSKISVGRFELGGGAVVGSLLFAWSHFWITPEWGRLAVFFPSLLFGWLRDRYQTLVGPILFHAACNLWGILLYTST